MATTDACQTPATGDVPSHLDSVRGATFLCVLIGLAGIALNLGCAYLTNSESVLSVMVLASMFMMACGWIPTVKKWPYSRVATVVNAIAMAAYLSLIHI